MVGAAQEDQARRRAVAVIYSPYYPQNALFMRSIEAAASTFEVRMTAAPVHGYAEIEHAISPVASEPNGGLIVYPDFFNVLHRELIIALAAKHRVPSVYSYGVFAKSGGLLSYSVDFFELLRQAVVYIDRILNGAKPADLPVQQATKFQLFMNLKTAKELGITVPPSLLVQADEVIE
jgi:putative ABC transport system substrate-binding protein